VPKASLTDWLRQKRRHLGVAPKYKLATKIRLAVEPVTRGLLYASLIALIVLACRQVTGSGEWPELIALLPAIIAIGAMLLRWIGQSVLLNIPAQRWGTTKTVLLIPLWETVLPMITLLTMIAEPFRPKPKRW